MAAGKPAMRLGAVLLVLLAMALQAAQAVEYNVGENGGWTIPNQQDHFNRWAVGRTYYVGDKLKFNYNPEMHNVMKVGSVDDYHRCTMSKPLSEAYTTGSTTFTLDKEGDHFFICSVAGHCADGMKLAVKAIQRPH